MMALTTLSSLRHRMAMKRGGSTPRRKGCWATGRSSGYDPAGKAWVVSLILAVQPLCAFAASYHSAPNPVGEQVYSTHVLSRVAPILILIVGFTLAWALNKARHKARKPAQDAAKSHD